ncbi:hypothetical protein IV203_021317 [Nitzschia inconspicua]|uniref:Uncharacterized protein n=1 Tax=Nitzschia inconspicua TaxID=303405 RepID=A0A9K3KGW5_9STRA|nr:hypothetical protein IV203_021317 [Nitzschia inconspicua]
MPRVQRCPAGHISSSRTPVAKKTRPAADPPIHGTFISDNDDATTFTEQFIVNNNNNKMQVIHPVDTMESYTLEAKPTRATLAETFSSGDDGDSADENHYFNTTTTHEQRQDDDDEYHAMRVVVNRTFSSEDGYQHGVPDLGQSFINLAEEAAYPEQSYRDENYHEDEDDNGRDDYLSNRLGTDSSYSSGEDFINMAEEAAQNPSRHFRSTVNMREDEFESYAQVYGMEDGEEEDMGREEDDTVLQFVDSEDGQAFSFRTRTDHARLATTKTYENSSRHHRTTDCALQENVSLEATSMGYETCSKTLNTNLETLHTDMEGVNYIPTLNQHDILHDPAYHHHGEIELHAATGDLADGESYEDDDDEHRIGDGGSGTGFDYHHGGALGVHIVPTTSYMYEDDGFIRDDGGLHQNGTFQETVTTFQDDTITEYTKDTKTVETQDGERDVVLSQLEDSYLSDRSSTTSWDEGSYASASRNVSRIDSFDGTEFTEETGRGNGTLLDILKSFRDMNVRSSRNISDSEDDDDDGEADLLSDIDEDEAKTPRRNSRGNQRRRSRGKSTNRDFTSVLGQIGAAGMDLLNETIEQSQQGSSRSSSRRRRRRSDPTGKIIESLRDIFSCGAPSRY